MSTPTDDEIAAYVMPVTPIRAAEIALLFGTRHGVDVFCQEALRLWQLGLYRKLVISGGRTRNEPQSEAETIGDALAALGLPRTAMILEDQALHTGDNVILSKAAIDAEIGLRNVDAILAIGKIPSSRRYLMTLERHWPGPAKMIAPVNYFGVPKDLWRRYEEFERRVTDEWEKIPRYLAAGHLAEISCK